MLKNNEMIEKRSHETVEALIEKGDALVKVLASPLNDNQSWDLMFTKLEGALQNAGYTAATATTLLPVNGRMKLFKPAKALHMPMIGLLFDLNQCRVVAAYPSNIESNARLKEEVNSGSYLLPITLSELRVRNDLAISANMVLPHNEVLAEISLAGLKAVFATTDDLLHKRIAVEKKRLIKEKFNIDLPVFVISETQYYAYTDEMQKELLNFDVAAYSVVVVDNAEEVENSNPWEPEQAYQMIVKNWSELAQALYENPLLADKVIDQYPEHIASIMSALNGSLKYSHYFYYRHKAEKILLAKFCVLSALKIKHTDQYIFTDADKRLMDKEMLKIIHGVKDVDSLAVLLQQHHDGLYLNQHRHHFVDRFFKRSMTHASSLFLNAFEEKYHALVSANNSLNTKGYVKAAAYAGKGKLSEMLLQYFQEGEMSSTEKAVWSFLFSAFPKQAILVEIKKTVAIRSDDSRLQLIAGALDQSTPLGKRLWQQEGWVACRSGAGCIGELENMLGVSQPSRHIGF